MSATATKADNTSGTSSTSGKEDKLLFDGVIEEALRGRKFRVRLDNGHELVAYLSGRMRRNHIRVLLGDRVQVEVSPYDLTQGRLTYRYK